MSKKLKDKFTKLAIVLGVVAFIVILIYFATAQSRENYRLFKQMCENKEYRIEIVDGNYTVEDINNTNYKSVLSDEYHKSTDENKIKKTSVINIYDIFVGHKLIAKTYEVVRPKSSIEIAINISTHSEFEYCGYDYYGRDIKEYLINNAKGEKNE